MRINKITLLSVSFVLVSLMSCDKNNNISIFSIDDDIALGADVASQIESDPSFSIMSRAQYAEAYAYLDSVAMVILNSDDIAYRDEFVWDFHLIQDDNTLNAFATPGGYIYVYTGLIKYLYQEDASTAADAFAGVIGHEIAHADLRHTSRSLQRNYGVSILLSIIAGENANQLTQIAGQIAGTVAGLSFSREFETESDEKSVEYLGGTDFACDGAKIFFEHLDAAGQGTTTQLEQWLSTHPNPDNRIENITAKAEEENCDTETSSSRAYAEFVASLP